MALNLGATLRDAVDGPVPGLDDVVGEDPADVDLPALSARIRHRRRARAATRSAVGLAAAGALAVVGVQGLGGRGVQAYTDPLSAEQAAFCGTDVTTMPTLADDVRLVRTGATAIADDSGGVGLADGASNLGMLAGRTLTTGVVQNPSATTGTAGDIALTKGSTVVAVGTAVRTGSGVQVGPAGTGSVTSEISAVTADLLPCPMPGGTPARVPAGGYSVQYLVPVATAPPSGFGPAHTVVERSAAGPWVVTLLDEPPAVTLPAGYPADEVPVVGGTLLSSSPGLAADGTWQVSVTVVGDDALTRAAAALRAAGATVVAPDATVAAAGWAAATTRTAIEIAAAAAQRDTAAADVQQALAAYTQLLATKASPDTMAWAAREAQAAQQRLADAQAELAQLQSGPADPVARTYGIVAPTTLQATTHSWSVVVTQDVQGGRTVLTYTLTHR